MARHSSGIGLLGGTFDPIHQGHIRLASALRDELALREVRLIPAGIPYHRAKPPQASPLQRLTMVQLAIEQEPCLTVDEREIKRQDVTYTIDTLTEIRREIGEQERLWFLMGEDAFATLPTWKNWQSIFLLTNIAVAKREHSYGDDMTESLKVVWKQRWVKHDSQAPAGQIYNLTLPYENIASQVIREQLSKKEHGDQPLPLCQAVLDYAKKHKIY